MRNVTIQKNAFVFCRYGVALLIWAALIFQSTYLLGLAFIILALSALLKVERAPMVWLYTNSLGRFVESKDVVLDERAMRFAHGSGTCFVAISLILVYFMIPFAWVFVACFALLKTVSALGFCPAYKLFGCMSNGTCCAFAVKK